PADGARLMSTNTDLAAWGEPPATPAEEFLAAYLEWLECGEETQPLPTATTAPAAEGDGLVQGLTLVSRGASCFRKHTGSWPPEVESGEPSGDGLPDPLPGEFRIRRLLGEGAFGKVWLADDLNLPRSVALKTVQPQGDPSRLAQGLAALR